LEVDAPGTPAESSSPVVEALSKPMRFVDVYVNDGRDIFANAASRTPVKQEAGACEGPSCNSLSVRDTWCSDVLAALGFLGGGVGTVRSTRGSAALGFLAGGVGTLRSARGSDVLGALDGGVGNVRSAWGSADLGVLAGGVGTMRSAQGLAALDALVGGSRFL